MTARKGRRVDEPPDAEETQAIVVRAVGEPAYKREQATQELELAAGEHERRGGRSGKTQAQKLRSLATWLRERRDD
jgi:hypothetical protein